MDISDDTGTTLVDRTGTLDSTWNNETYTIRNFLTVLSG